MNRFSLTMLLFMSLIVNFANGQNAVNIANYESNQDYKLFPENSEGVIVFTDIINSDIDAKTMVENAELLLFDLKVLMKADISDAVETPHALRCIVQLPVGDDYIDFSKTGFWGGDYLKIRRDKSVVSFVMALDFKDGKMRYKLFDFYTKRRSLRGDAKSEGQSNTIHWQRVNSLKKELREERKSEDIMEKKAIIDDEILQYEAERKAVDIFIDKVKEMIVSGVDDF